MKSLIYEFRLLKRFLLCKQALNFDVPTTIYCKRSEPLINVQRIESEPFLTPLITGIYQPYHSYFSEQIVISPNDYYLPKSIQLNLKNFSKMYLRLNTVLCNNSNDVPSIPYLSIE